MNHLFILVLSSLRTFHAESINCTLNIKLDKTKCQVIVANTIDLTSSSIQCKNEQEITFEKENFLKVARSKSPGCGSFVFKMIITRKIKETRITDGKVFIHGNTCSLKRNTMTTTKTTNATKSTPTIKTTTTLIIAPTLATTKDNWETIFFQPKEHNIIKNSLLTTLPTLKKEWRVSHEFFPTDYSSEEWTDSLHLTIEGDKKQYGHKTPAILFRPGQGLYISSAISGNPSYSWETFTDIPPLNTWTNITITQEQDSNSKFMFSIMIGDKLVHTTENTQPQEFSNVRVYASNPWWTAQPGKIKNLVVQTN